VSVLRTKRAEISGHIRELEIRIDRLWARLIHIDVSLTTAGPADKPLTVRHVLVNRPFLFNLASETELL
jgi:hypothetical protein